MFCSECGAKNADSAKFCEECGAILEEVNAVKDEKTKTSSKNISINKKQKSLMILILVIIVIIFAFYKIIATSVSPERIVEDYIQAISSKDYDTLYEIAGFSGDTTFLTKEQFQKFLDNRLGDTPISNYNVGKNISYENGNLKAKVPVNIVSNIGYTEQEITVELSKLQSKKYLFFDDWKISNMSSLINYSIIKDFKISVPKGTKISFGGINVENKYLDESNSDENEDIYLLPQVLSQETLIVFELSNGVKIEKNIDRISYGYYSLELSLDDFSDEEKEKINNLLKKDITSLINLTLQNKSFDEAKNSFPLLTTDSMKKNYENQLKYLENLKYSVSDFNIKEVNLKSISLNTNSKLSISFSIDYSWNATSKESANTKSETELEFLTCIYDLEKDGYALENLQSFPSLYVYMY